MNITPMEWNSLYQGCRLIVNGEDLTDRCYEIDMTAGIAYCFIHNDEGKPYISGNDLAREHIYGEIEIIGK